MSCGLKRILQFREAMAPGPVVVYDGSGKDVSAECKYSWSTDTVCWTNWVDQKQYNIITKNVDDELYIRVLLFGSFDRISMHGVFTKCYNIFLDNSNPFLESLCGNENQFNPYSGLDCALQLQQQLSDSVVCMFGIPVYYFRVKPNKTTADYTFKEYVLHNVESVKQINLIIPNGTMPSSNPKFTALDFDWQTDWDVEIGKTQFATAFGDDAFPKMRDFIYIPMQKRMWDVNTAYDEKKDGLLWRSTTWKLSLVKYEDAANIDTPDDLQSLIDNWTVNRYDDVFGKKEEREQERLSGEAQVSAPKRSENNLYDISMQDAIRQKYSKQDISIIDCQYNHHSNIITRNMYKFKKPESKLIYQKGYCGNEGTLSFILQTQDNTVGNNCIIQFGPIQVFLEFFHDDKDRYKITFNGMTGVIDAFSTNLIILRWNKKTYSSSINIYKYIHQDGIAAYLLRPEMYWFDEKPACELSTDYNPDFETNKEESGILQTYPCMITNIKLYNRDLGLDDAIKESIKYTTTHKACVINDLARKITDGLGYQVK